MALKIPREEISYSELSMVDDVGRVFHWQGRIFRAIKPEAVDRVRELFDRGVVDLIVGKGLFVPSWISELVLDGFPLVVEHKVIPAVTYPYEWSFSMLKDAAGVVIDLNDALRPFGFQTRDAHGFNLVFDGGCSRFVDLGSLTKLTPGSKGWLAEEEFVRCYYYPLKMWSAGDADLARAAIAKERTPLSHGAYLRYRHPLLRCIASGTLHRWGRYYYRFKSLSSVETQRVVDARLPGRLGRWILALQRKRLLPLQKVSFGSWRARIRRLSAPKTGSPWAEYQRELMDEGGGLKSTPRYDRILGILRDLKVESMIEFGGNQGVFSRLAASELALKRIVCTDADEGAVDELYGHVRQTGLPITPAVFDCVFPTLTRRSTAPAVRLRCDAAVALALTHHLVLTQKVPLDHLFRVFADYAAKYLIVEFMPLGLWDGKKSLPHPEWYSREWFRKTFQGQFKLLMEEELEQNRIVFVGEKAAGS